ncbi:hypothetical protein ABC345_18625 [Shouchella sp. 1P09AA]|uniref:hypothetical protein n=1 Tax=unclassified Shouchella TaxID=2893065 RepID=UPI0039A2FBFF
MYEWLNLGSLVIGLLAWTLPILNLVKHHKRWVIVSLASMSACIVSICFQLLYNDYLVRIEDWSALMDTSQSVILLSFILAAGTIFLNGITVFIYRKKREYM